MTTSRVMRSSTGRTVRRAVSTPNRTSAAASGSADARCHGRAALLSLSAHIRYVASMPTPMTT